MSAVRAFLLGVLPPGVPVVRGQVNRVAEPSADDFIVIWPLRQQRLSTNITDFYDNVLTGDISETTLTVSAIRQQESPLYAGMTLTDGTAGAIAPNTVLGAQISGSLGGTGTYNVAPTQSLGNETIYAGVRADLTPTEWTVQCDVHGPNSGDNSRIIEGLFRSEYGVEAVSAGAVAAGAMAYSVVPLYCDEARQVPFLNAEQQYENRWSLDLHLQINPVISTPQEFAQQVQVRNIEASVTYAEGGLATAGTPVD